MGPGARRSWSPASAARMSQAIERWRLLSSSDRFSFSEYAGFLLTYPGFPEEPRSAPTPNARWSGNRSTMAGWSPSSTGSSR